MGIYWGKVIKGRFWWGEISKNKGRVKNSAFVPSSEIQLNNRFTLLSKSAGLCTGAHTIGSFKLYQLVI